MLIIPNPLYDVVFKYLMEDTATTKLALSKGQALLELKRPLEALQRHPVQEQET